MLLKLLVSEIIIIVLSEDILQSGLDQSAKDAFNDDLQSIIIKVKNQMPHISRPYWPFGRWISKVFNGKLAFGERRKEGERLLEFATFFDLPVLKLV